ncbi:hypothetical protein SAMN05216548_114136 [Faunimonas pinastri]|uniref:Uncharacterized protein n=1 Tax=Faunimonas pinastri TaxID=1855383 RepID=A0A1H9N1Q4_9HYPH|nr:hypothetical protein [Faunimonas pinastri]SER29585.1 hypothetical protein SAMN05216548_114136 [Faunimonas pinastri]
MFRLKIKTRTNADWSRSFRLTNADGDATLLDGSTMEMQLRKNASDKEVALDLTSSNGGITIAKGTNQFVLAIGKGKLTAGKYVGDLLRTVNGSTSAVAEVIVDVAQGVTR